jgi:predicted XRE-type DNA-binding protein
LWLDLGFSKAESFALDVRTEAFMTLQSALKASTKTQKELATILGADQPKISKIMNGKMSEFSTDRVIEYLFGLGYEVRLEIVPQDPGEKIQAAAKEAPSARRARIQSNRKSDDCAQTSVSKTSPGTKRITKQISPIAAKSK